MLDDPLRCSCAVVRDSPGPWGLPDWWAALAGELFDDVFFCAPEADPTALATVSPLASPAGLLGLIHAALVASRNPRVVILPNTLPGPEVLRALALDPADADVLQLQPEAKEQQPSLLPARFNRRCLRPLERAMGRGEDGLPAGLRIRRLSG